MPLRSDMNSYRKQVEFAENCIRDRSKKAEGRWCTEKWQSSSAGEEKVIQMYYLSSFTVETDTYVFIYESD